MKDEQTAAHAQRKTSDIQHGIPISFSDIPESNL
jgi:hypothetical protein